MALEEEIPPDRSASMAAAVESGSADPPGVNENPPSDAWWLRSQETDLASCEELCPAALRAITAQVVVEMAA